MSPEEIRLALAVLDTRARLIFRMAVFDWMRPGEILGINSARIYEHSVLIDIRMYKGDVGTPKRPEGEADLANGGPHRAGRRSESVANAPAQNRAGTIPVSDEAGEAAESRSAWDGPPSRF
jgi:hypothetical protein